MAEGTTSADKTRGLPLQKQRSSTEPAALVQLAGPGAVRFFVLAEELTRLGRGRECNDIVLNDPWVSREHTEIALRNGIAELRDRKSRNGCIVNSKAVRESRLKDGDLIQIGRATFKFLEAGSAERPFYEEVFRLAFHDPVTGTYSRRYFDEALEREVLRATRHETPLSILLVDVDEFKRINDERGHASGDRVLRKIASTLRAELRGESVLARFGGDEFVILLPASDEDETQLVAERLRATVENLDLDESSGSPVTLSIGCTTAVPTRETQPGQLLGAADAALYAAKRGGRNRVRHAGLDSALPDPIGLATPLVD